MSSFSIPDFIIFWRWLSPDSMVLITKSSVYRAFTTQRDGGPPLKMLDWEFSRKGGSDNQVHNYEIDSRGKWAFLIWSSSGGVTKDIMLYEVELGPHKRPKKIKEAFTCCFIRMPMTDMPNLVNNLFSFCVRRSNELTELHIMELGGKSKIRIKKEMAFGKGDYPVLMQGCANVGLILVLTKFGFLQAYEASTGAFLTHVRLTQHEPLYLI